MWGGVPPAIHQGLSQNQRHLAMHPAGRLDGDFNVLAQGGEKVHPALHREVAGLPAHETGNVGLPDPEDLSRLRLGEAAPVDFERQSSFEVLPCSFSRKFLSPACQGMCCRK